MLPGFCISVLLLFLVVFSIGADDDSFETAFRRLLTSDRKNASVDYNGSMRQVLFVDFSQSNASSLKNNKNPLNCIV